MRLAYGARCNNISTDKKNSSRAVNRNVNHLNSFIYFIYLPACKTKRILRFLRYIVYTIWLTNKRARRKIYYSWDTKNHNLTKSRVSEYIHRNVIIEGLVKQKQVTLWDLVCKSIDRCYSCVFIDTHEN